MKTIRKATAGLMALALGLGVLGASGAWAQSNSANVVLTRTVSGNLEANAILQVTVTISKNADAVILALGLYETLPTGWTFKGNPNNNGNVDSASNQQFPTIFPDDGTSGVLDFAWITPPSFPYSMTYSIQAPNEVSSVDLTGFVEYRQTQGRELSAVTTTTIEPSKGGFCGCAPSTGVDGSRGDLAVIAGAALLLAGGTYLRRRRAAEAVRTDHRS